MIKQTASQLKLFYFHDEESSVSVYRLLYLTLNGIKHDRTTQLIRPIELFLVPASAPRLV